MARDLLGCRLVRVDRGNRLSGVIVETEAYRGVGDPASHAYAGKTERNSVMFGEAGHAYLYFIYGFHHCLNVTTEGNGRPGAVLLRAVEPREGGAQMARNRRVGGGQHLTDGPGRLTQALGIDRRLNGEDMVASETLFIERGPRPKRIGTSGRVGIKVATERRWRYFVADSRFLSRGKPPAPPQNP